MEVVILAGGYGSRISEETHRVPKPMVKIGDMPIILHLMKYYSCFGFKDFIICSGYKSEEINKFFINLNLIYSDIEIDLENGNVKNLNKTKFNFNIKIINTGLDSNTGKRLFKIKKYIKSKNFLFTYGDCLSNVNLTKLVNFHKLNQSMVTLTTKQMPTRYGILKKRNKKNKFDFYEKENLENLINCGFFVLNKKIFNYLNKNNLSFEKDVLTKISKQDMLSAYKHNDFWQSMDTLREKIILEDLWNKKKAPWKIWKD